MNVIVVGALRELQHLLLELSRRGHHVVVVDNNVERIKALEERLDIPCYNVDLLDYEALNSIGFHRADVLIAAHPEDSINLVVSVYAKTEGIPRIYAVVSEEAIARALVGLNIVRGIVLRGASVVATLRELVYGVKILNVGGSMSLVVADTRTLDHLVGARIGELRGGDMEVLAVIDKNGKYVTDVPDDYVISEGVKIIALVKSEKLEESLKLEF